MSLAVKYYLGVFNCAAFISWTLYLICFMGAGFELNTVNIYLLNIAQGLALLEIVHVMLRWVKSPILSTIAQVTSRILVLVLIDIFTQSFTKSEVLSHLVHIGVIIVSSAWAVTEMIRYSLYFISLFSEPPFWLLWMRYSFFIILYPLGVAGEWFIISAPVIACGLGWDVYCVFAFLLLISYLYYFPVLYKYMWRQRTLKLSE